MKSKQFKSTYLAVPEKLETLKQFYQLMHHTRQIRQEIYCRLLEKTASGDDLLKPLQLALERLQSVPGDQDKYVLLQYDQRTVRLDLTYETSELEKDIFFLTHPFGHFYNYLDSLHPGFQEQVAAALHYLAAEPIFNWLTDRDGTVNNYCARYKSSIQSLYNALFLTQFASQKCAHRSVILTSAPLLEDGLLDVSITHPSLFTYAGSKGRDFMDNRLGRHQYPVSPEKQARLNELNSWLKTLIDDPHYEIFSLIGSGLQCKLGETTVAYQDVPHSIPEPLATQFTQAVSAKVRELDPTGEYFKTIKTGTDLEVVLTTTTEAPDGSPKEFDKGDGIRFIDQMIDLQLRNGTTLVCGDTAADLAMVKAVRDVSEQTLTFFVTEDRRLQQQVRELCPAACFVSSPDILVTALYLSASNTEEHNFEKTK